MLGNTAAHNIKKTLVGSSVLKPFSYRSKGMMATIGNKAGVASLMGHNISGIFAWIIWRSYYLSHLPTFEQKIKIGIDWAINIFFGTDLTMIGETTTKKLSQITIEDPPSLKDQLFSDLQPES